MGLCKSEARRAAERMINVVWGEGMTRERQVTRRNGGTETGKVEGDTLQLREHETGNSS